MQTLSALSILALCCSAQRIPADYQAYLDASAAASGSNYAEAIALLERVWRSAPRSPLEGKAALLAAQCYTAARQPKNAVAVLRRYAATLPQPEGHAAAGTAAEAAGEPAAAASCWQRVFYEFPLSPQTAEAEEALVRLKATPGSRVPPPVPKDVFDRAEKLRRGGQAARASRELLAAAAQFSGLDRELAFVRARTGDVRALRALTVSHPDAEAERVYLIHAAARRNSLATEAESAMRELDRRFPKSRWTMEALISWGNHHLLRNNTAEYVPLYRACYQRFPQDPQASLCHWRVAWAAWMARDTQAKTLLEEHLRLFPESERASAALYFLRRYDALTQRYPQSFYTVLARSKQRSALTRADPDPALWTATASMTTRTARASQLQIAGLYEWAEFELKYAAEEQPFVAAMELAEVAAARGAHDRALRYVKSVAKGYLRFAQEAAPERFWRLAFPLPYRESVEKHAHANGLDPFLVAALIRQESEFNPNAVSRANAYGLTQVLPSTGRQLSRSAGIRSFRPESLFDPDVNVQLGTQYLRWMLDAHGGSIEKTLASYNAGKRRTDRWSTWYEYREPAEFVETIPFSETHTYVQAVLRNADVYRRVYARADVTQAHR